MQTGTNVKLGVADGPGGRYFSIEVFATEDERRAFIAGFKMARAIPTAYLELVPAKKD